MTLSRIFKRFEMDSCFKKKSVKLFIVHFNYYTKKVGDAYEKMKI